MEKVGAALLLLCWLGRAVPAGAQPSAFLYKDVPDFSFASAQLPGHSLQGLGLKYRKLILFAPSPDDPLFKRQQELLGSAAARKGMRERDMILIPVLQKGGEDMDAAAAAKVAAGYGVAPGSFAVLLIGRTNVLKCWSDKPFAPVFLFELIDSLPMRRHEMQAGAASRG